MMVMAMTATPTPIPAFAPLLNPLLDEVLGVPLESPVPVAVDIAVFVLIGEPNPTVVGTAFAEGGTTNTGVLVPFSAVGFGLRSKLQLGTPFHTNCMSREPL
jgi:hypothetical protein